jgi:tetratricopeptide (TPR) repeat protein
MMLHRFPAHRAALRAALLAGLLSTQVAAQSRSDSTAAQALFDQAKKLMAEGHAAEACPRFEESQRLDPGSGTLLNLARCYEQLGRLSSAWNSYLEAASAARASGNAQREKEARKRAEALRPRLSNLVITIGPEVEATVGLEIARDGARIGEAQRGVPIPADQGEHTVAATAPGYVPWQTVIAVKGEGTTTTVNVPALAREATLVSAPVVAPPPPPEVAPIESSSSGLGTQRTLALVAGGVGVVGLGVGTVFAFKSMSNHDEAEKYCQGIDCTDPRGVSAGNDAYAAGNVATVAMLVGAAGIAGGLALWFTAPNPARGAEARIMVSPTSVGVRGAW